uniref:NADH-ubiquinone oxidoreductase chain 4L n=1 Tax=Robertsicus elaphensis TaxID=2599317 RepID=H9M757_9ACAR|nr:NADH dehydrogenase subunit 4L [Robertsicus elaphensis]AET63074.1 NADH dehydrogenase subunit 4L [Robertsicus elaphensis]
MLMIISLLYLMGLFSLIFNRFHILMLLMSMEFIYLSLLMILILMSLTIINFLMFLVMIVCESALGLSLLIMMSYFYGNEMINSMNMIKC